MMLDRAQTKVKVFKPLVSGATDKVVGPSNQVPAEWELIKTELAQCVEHTSSFERVEELSERWEQFAQIEARGLSGREQQAGGSLRCKSAL